jgi:hypothetical protein
MEVVNSLVGFVIDDCIQSAILDEARSSIGARNFRIVAIKLLGWLKSQARLGKQYPLKVNCRYRWCQDLTILITEHGFLGELVELSDETLIWRVDVSEPTRRQVCSFVDREYNPPLMV